MTKTAVIVLSRYSLHIFTVMSDGELFMELPLGVVVTWLTGITLSIICLIAQLLLYYFLPDIRKIDQKILTHLTIARLANTIVEYLMADIEHISNKSIVKTILSALYVQTDTVLICWMFVYTKNIYDKVVQVFFLQQFSSFKLSLLIWLGTLPVGMLYPLFINLSSAESYQKVYSVLKFIVVSVNVLFFCKIFYVVAVKHRDANRNIGGIMKTCMISFLLVCITSLQVALTDLFSFYSRNSVLIITFCVINSYQVLAISIIFGIVSRNSKHTN